MAALIKGIPVTLYERTKTGEDAFHEPVYAETPVTVENVLITPVTLRHRPQSCSFPGVIWFMSFASPRPTLTNGRAALWSFSGRDGES